MTRVCDQIQQCPCDGCCDFNCCDELDYFMKRAYYDVYNDTYGTFEAFYDSWYEDFYDWYFGL